MSKNWWNDWSILFELCWKLKFNSIKWIFFKIYLVFIVVFSCLLVFQILNIWTTIENEYELMITFLVVINSQIDRLCWEPNVNHWNEWCRNVQKCWNFELGWKWKMSGKTGDKWRNSCHFSHLQAVQVYWFCVGWGGELWPPFQRRRRLHRNKLISMSRAVHSSFHHSSIIPIDSLSSVNYLSALGDDPAGDG